MVKWLMGRWIRRFERLWNYDASYLREMLDASPRAAWASPRCHQRPRG
jgi:hypothetical protein